MLVPGGVASVVSAGTSATNLEEGTKTRDLSSGLSWPRAGAALVAAVPALGRGGPAALQRVGVSARCLAVVVNVVTVVAHLGPVPTRRSGLSPLAGDHLRAGRLHPRLRPVALAAGWLPSPRQARSDRHGSLTPPRLPVAEKAGAGAVLDDAARSRVGTGPLHRHKVVPALACRSWRPVDRRSGAGRPADAL